MPYIGKTELKSSDVVADSFTGNGSTTTFTLSKVPPSDQAVLVSINGVKQHTDAYSISGTTLTLSAAPDSGDAIEAVSIIDIGEAAGDSLPTQTGNSGKFLTTDGSDASWSTKLEETSTGIDVTGTITANDTLNIENTSGYGGIEVGGASGGYIDFKAPFSDDFDLRLITYSGLGGQLETSTGNLNIQTGGSDSVVISTGGNNERFRINSLGKVSLNGASTASLGAGGLALSDRLAVPAGSSGTPSIHSPNDSNTGINLIESDRLAFITAGVERLRITSGGFLEATSASNIRLVLGSEGNPTNNSSNWIRGNTNRLQFNNAGGGFMWETGGSEKMRIDSSGNVGIGNSSPSYPLDINGTINISSGSATRWGSGDAEIRNSGWNLLFKTYTGSALSEHMRIDSSGNVGIGTSSPARELHIKSSDGYAQCILEGTTASELWFTDVGDGSKNGMVKYDHSSESMRLYANNSERLRIDSSGNVLIGTTSNSSANSGNGVFFQPDGVLCGRRAGTILYLNRQSVSGTHTSVAFQADGSVVGSIAVTNSSTSYNTSSDYRLKENVVPMTGSIDRLKELNPSRFNFIADADTTVDGFIAHEAKEVVPEAVSGVKDGKEMQGIDQGKLVPLLVGALQEAIARIETLESQIGA